MTFILHPVLQSVYVFAQSPTRDEAFADLKWEISKQLKQSLVFFSLYFELEQRRVLCKSVTNVNDAVLGDLTSYPLYFVKKCALSFGVVQ
jgi:hypothetical protein